MSRKTNPKDFDIGDSVLIRDMPGSWCDGLRGVIGSGQEQLSSDDIFGYVVNLPPTGWTVVPRENLVRVPKPTGAACQT